MTFQLPATTNTKATSQTSSISLSSLIKAGLFLEDVNTLISHVAPQLPANFFGVGSGERMPYIFLHLSKDLAQNGNSRICCLI